MDRHNPAPSVHLEPEGFPFQFPPSGEKPQLATRGSEGEASASRPSKRQRTTDDPDHHIASVHGWPPSWQEGLDPAANSQPKSRPHEPNGQLPPYNYLVVYRVVCDLRKTSEEDHSQHHGTAYYQDEPRLFAKDTRGSALRGQRIIQDLGAYLEEQQQLAFVVYKDYDCPRYHDQMKEHFVNMAPENIDRASFLRLKPWFQVVPQDTEPVSARAEQIVISQVHLMAAFEELVSQDVENLGFWNRETSLRAPYDYFYHTHSRIRELLTDSTDLSDATSPSISLLLDYVEAACHPQWAETDSLFEQGLVTANTFSKLFRPGEIIVGDEDGIIWAYRAKNVDLLGSSRTSIICWTLAFDGALHRVTSQILVEWHGRKDETIEVQDLEAWPLRLDKTGLRDCLEKRGIAFWQCRRKSLFSYDGPQSSTFEVQTVSQPRT